MGVKIRKHPEQRFRNLPVRSKEIINGVPLFRNDAGAFTDAGKFRRDNAERFRAEIFAEMQPQSMKIIAGKIREAPLSHAPGVEVRDSE